MRKNWKLWIGLAVMALTVVGLVVIPAAMADGSSDEAVTPSPTPPDPDTVCSNFAGKVAANLGVSVDTLKNAVTDAALQMVDEALANGSITQEQADRMKERIREGGAGCCLGWFGGRWGGPRCGFGPMGCLEKAVEDGIITQEQADQIKTLARQIREQIRERLRDGFLGEAVENGILTQEQADQIGSLCDQTRAQLKEQIRGNCGKGRMWGPRCGNAGSATGQ